MTVYNHEQIYEQLKLRIKSLIDKTITPNLTVTVRGASNQKPTNSYVQLWFRDWDKKGKYDIVDTNTTAVKYEVTVDISIHRPPTAISLVGTTTVSLNRIINAFEASAGTYFDSFADNNISYLRSSSVTQRHWPIDRNQLEERSTVSCVFEVVVVETDTTDVGYIETIQLNVKSANIESSENITYQEESNLP